MVSKVAWALPILVGLAGIAAAANPKSRRVQVHLYGGDLRDGAPLAAWYHGLGITDVWLYPVAGAFRQDQRPETQKTVRRLSDAGILAAYRKHHIHCWWFERPVPDFFYEISKATSAPQRNLWDDAPETDVLWAGVCDRIARIYPGVRRAGFSGIVYDAESYYSYKGDEQGKEKPWVWGGHAQEYGKDGGYYRRGLQVGRAILAVWPRARIIMVYAHGYEGERWWYQGFHDAGVDFYLGAEHTYGAGPGDLGKAWYQSWWGGRRLRQTCDWKRSQFPFVSSNQRVIAGLFPIDFGAGKPNYRARYFREQLAAAAGADPGGPIPVWLWPQGPFTPESWQGISYADGDTAADYLRALREFSAATP